MNTSGSTGILWFQWAGATLVVERGLLIAERGLLIAERGLLIAERGLLIAERGFEGAQASVAVAHGLRRTAARGIFPDQRLDLYSLH